MLGRYSQGRLTVTNSRLIYRTGRDPALLFLLRPPRSVGNIEVSLASIGTIKQVPWRSRALWELSGFPGVTMLEIRTADGERLRFGNIIRRSWEATRDELSLSGSTIVFL
jgi:hypothetical protein